MVYVALAVETLLHLKYNTPFRYVEQPRTLEKGQPAVSKKLQLMLCGMAICTLCIFIRLAFNPSAMSSHDVLKSILRSVYRTVELANGWSGPVISTERYFGTLSPSSLGIR